MTALAPELCWTGEAFERGLVVTLGDDGRIASVGRGSLDIGGEALPGRALLPGFVNAHSHAFQRGLRGRGESFPGGVGSFWSWREAMYGLVAEMDAERMHALSLQAFGEMLGAGITSVGEFHYLHHDASGAGYALDDAVVAAAQDAGIRLVLLEAYYATGDVGKALEGAQERFRTSSPGEYWDRMETLADRLDPATQSLGAVVHSLRAASLDDLAAVHAGAREHGLVFHIHVGEQRREIEDCLDAYGRTPLALVNDLCRVDARTTVVHATHSTPEDLQRFAAAGGNVCLCPTTEADLGDGVCDLPWLRERGASIALGTDSNLRISMLEELRWLEHAQRLAHQRRGVFTDDVGNVAAPLLRAGTLGGARSLGLEAGALEAGALADLVSLDLGVPALAGADESTLAEALVFGCGDEAVDAVWVGGRRVRA